MPIYIGAPFDGSWKRHHETGPGDLTYYPPHIGGDMQPLPGQLPYLRFIGTDDGRPLKAKVVLVAQRPSGGFVWLSPLAPYTLRPLCTIEYLHLEPGSTGLLKGATIDSGTIIGVLGKGPYKNWTAPNCHIELRYAGVILWWDAREGKAGLKWPGDYIIEGVL